MAGDFFSEVFIRVGTQRSLVLGLLADQPEEEKVVTGDVHFWEGIQVTLQGGGPLGLRWGLPHG